MAIPRANGVWTEEAYQAKQASQAARYCAYSARTTRPPMPEEFSGAFITDGEDAASCVAEVIYAIAGASATPGDPESPVGSAVRSAIRAALVPWVLGDGDPLRPTNRS